LYLRVILGVVIGAAVGAIFGSREIALGWTTAHLGAIASLYIQLLTALATPLIFFAIVDAFVQAQISGRQGMKMLLICGINIAVAFTIGLTILNVWQPGRTWQNSLPDRSAETAVAEGQKVQELSQQAGSSSLSPLAMIKSYIPRSIAQPISENMVLTVAVLAILVGAAMRSLKATPERSLPDALGTFERLITA
jgi:Na+/H+-dicarboxylate symporter